MAVHVYRFLGRGIDLSDSSLRQKITPSSIASVQAKADTLVVDLEEDDANFADLQDAMLGLGFVFSATDPTTTPNAVVAAALGIATFNPDTVLVDDVTLSSLADDPTGNLLVDA